MPASEAQILANRRNSERSTGPKTDEGKARSRANSFKHGMTGSGVVLAEEDSAEVARLSAAFARELGASGEAGSVLAERMATSAVRMRRCSDWETAHLSGRVRSAMAEAEVEAPEGASDEEVDGLRHDAARVAMFDPSPEAALARKYEAAAERTFFRSLKELRRLNAEGPRSAPAPAPAVPAPVAVAQAPSRVEAPPSKLGSFSTGAPASPSAPPKPAPTRPLPPLDLSPAGWDPFPGAAVDVPIAVGRPR